MKATKEQVLARLKQMSIYLVVIIALVAIDQVTKYLTVHEIGNRSIDIIPDVLLLTYVKNTGALWGLGQGYAWLFMVLTPLCLALLLVFYFKTPIDKKFRLVRIVLAVIIAGAIGNFIDRLVQGYVVDMIYFKLIEFPVFNVADSYVTVGVIALVLIILFWKDFIDAFFDSKK